YVGIHAGTAWSDTGWDNVSLTGTAHNFSDSGLIAGGQIGVRWWNPGFSWGLEATLSGTNLSEKDFVPPFISFGTGVDWVATVTGRAGWATNAWWLYGKAGWAWAGLELTGNQSAIPDSFSLSHTANGWTAGAGIEYKLAPSVSLALEYNFINLGGFDASGVTTQALPFTIKNVETDIQSVTLRLNVGL